MHDLREIGTDRTCSSVLFDRACVQLETYEVLVGDARAVHWVDAHGRLDLSALGARPVEGGHEADGTPLFVAKAHLHNSVHPGKISERLDGARSFRSTPSVPTAV